MHSHKLQISVFKIKKFPEIFINWKALKRERVTNFLDVFIDEISHEIHINTNSIKISKNHNYALWSETNESKETSKST